jgi:hypothetical protein
VEAVVIAERLVVFTGDENASLGSRLLEQRGGAMAGRSRSDFIEKSFLAIASLGGVGLIAMMTYVYLFLR